MDYEFIGWCHEDNHDKVWGIIVLERNLTQYSYNAEHRIITFWGRRGQKLKTKVSVEDQRSIHKLIDGKTKKGYEKISLDNLNKVYPEFQTDLEQTAFWSTLKS